MKRALLCAALISSAAVFILLLALWSDGSPILFESWESKTDTGSVFNRIQWISIEGRDVWMMQQTHHGLGPANETWDRLAIVVDKTQSPKRARFYQLKPGAMDVARFAKSLNQSGDTERLPGFKEIPLRIPCAMCHSNGPRAIRPKRDSLLAQVSSWDQARLALWNIRVKTYGRVLGEGHAPGEVPFKHPGPGMADALPVAVCKTCHNENWWGRGELTRQNALTIRFLVKEGQMPPPGFRLSEEEREQIKAFIGGFEQP